MKLVYNTPRTHKAIALYINMKLILMIVCRDLRETRQRFDSVGSEIRRKDNQIRELQQRLEVNEGCKFRFFDLFIKFPISAKKCLFFYSRIFSQVKISFVAVSKQFALCFYFFLSFFISNLKHVNVQ